MSAGAGPDLLGVCEAENRFVLVELAALLNARLPARRYDVAHADAAQDRRGIDTAFLFDAVRMTLVADSIFSHFVVRRTGTRDILQATFATNAGNELVALANHWPSRSGGALESAGFRATAGESLGYFHERIREVRGNDIAILALGDFNDDPHDASLRFNAVAWRERGDVERAESAKFYNLAWRYLTQSVTDRQGNPRVIDGSLYFGGNGNVFDQILVNRSLLNGERGLRVLEETARIEAFPAMVSHRVGEGPIRFGLPKGNPGNVNQDGFSDHFPVSVVLDEA
jgi:predicted extracellular nuclease